MTSFAPHNKKMLSFVQGLLLKENSNLQIEIVTDDQAEALAKKVSNEMKLTIRV
ncbi:MAG: hypothetical protein U5J95_12465 [Balneolaceae bacterium]|nr:hypothetical protein [Balneolaceae bacterium]